MNIKIRPSILVISIGLVVALIIAVRANSLEAITGIVGVLGGVASKLVESEEKG